MPLYATAGVNLAFDVFDGIKEKIGDIIMLKRIVLLLHGLLFLLFSTFVQTTLADGEGYKGMRYLPGWWKPFRGEDPANPSNASPWNKRIPATATEHPESGDIIPNMSGASVRFANDYQATLHVVNSNNSNLSKYPYHSQKEDGSNTNVYRYTHEQNTYNPDVLGNDITDFPYPFIPGKTIPEPFPEQDGRMTIVDINTNYAYEVSQGKAELDNCSTNTEPPGPHVWCSTFNIWDLNGTGTVKYLTPSCNTWGTCDPWWQCAGGRGAGVPVIAGMVRPEELYYAVSSEGDGVIHHALSFAYDRNRSITLVGTQWKKVRALYPFAYRSDGMYPGTKYPIEGMQFQLIPTYNVDDKISNQYGRVIARTLQQYGAVLVDNGGGNSMSFNLQNLRYVINPGGYIVDNRTAWEQEFPGFYDSITVLHPGDFRVVNTPETLGAVILLE